MAGESIILRHKVGEEAIINLRISVMTLYTRKCYKHL